MEVVKLEHITYAYESEKVLDDVSLSIEHGECVVLMGNNGCGKSTLLKVCNGLIEFDGDYWFEGKRINQKVLKDIKKSKEFHQRIGYVFQNSDVQLFSTHVYEEIAFAPSQMNLSDEEINQRVNDIIQLLDLEKLKDRAPYQLSGGEKRKVALGCVLSQNPDLLILDEPLASLDSKSQKWLYSFLNELKKSGKTMLIATHDEEFAKSIGDRIVCMSDDHKIV
jgi:cobalt/nickel transport system ATP-binding protein